MKIPGNLWASDLETGIYDTDRDLMKLFEQLALLVGAANNSCYSSFWQLFEAFEENLKWHFVRQLDLMTSCDYVNQEVHHIEHQMLLAELQHQRAEVRERGVSAAAAANLLYLRLRRHVLAQDVFLGQSLIHQFGVHDRRLSMFGTLPEFYAELGVGERRLEEIRAIEWSSKLATGNVLLDDDHRRLITMVNEILSAAQKIDHIQMDTLIIELARETEAHFGREEALMASVLSPEQAVEHQDKHRSMLNEVSAQIEEWRDKSISSGFLVRFLLRWLVSHILTEDRVLGQALLAMPNAMKMTE